MPGFLPFHDGRFTIELNYAKPWKKSWKYSEWLTIAPYLSVCMYVCMYVCVLVFQRYKRYSPYDMQESIRKEVKGDLEKSFLTLGASRSHIHRIP